MALDEDQVHLVGTHRNLLMGAGTRFDVQETFNPFATQVRAPQSEDRPYAHGILVGAEWHTERVVPIRVIANGSSRNVATARAAVQDMAAAFSAVGATGEIAALHFRLNEDPDEFVLFGRPRGIDPDLTNMGHGYAYVSTAFVASDPRIYSGLLATATTGLPLQQGGLTVPATAASTRLRLPGATGAYASTPNDASLHITGNLGVRALAGRTSWSGSGVEETLAARYDDSANDRAWRFSLNASGMLLFRWSTDGTAFMEAISSVPVPSAAGIRAVGAHIDTVTGTVIFETSDSIGGSWDQLGGAQVSGATSIAAGGADLDVGARDSGTRNPWSGVIYAVEVRDGGPSGSVAADPDFTNQLPGALSFTDSVGKSWTVNGTARLVGDTYRGGLTLPTTVRGVLVGGSLTLTNSGTTDTSLRIRIDGPAVEPRLVLRRPDGTVQTLSFELELAAGQWLDINTASGTALLNGLAGSNQRAVAHWDMDPYPLQPGINYLRFSSAAYNDAARMRAEYRSAWW